MAGRPRTRAKREAEARAAANPDTTTDTPTNTPPATTDTTPPAPAAKAPARKRKPQAKRPPAAKQAPASRARTSAGTGGRAGTGASGGTRTRAEGGAARKRPKNGKPPKRATKVRAAFEAATDDDYAAVAERLEEAAVKSAQGKGGEMTQEDRVERDEAVLAAHALSLRPGTIAERFGLTVQHVERIIDGHRERRRRVPIASSSDLLRDTLEALEAQMERCSIIAASSTAAESARIGAVRTWRELATNRLELLMAMGAINPQPSAAERDRRAGELLRAMLAELRTAGVPDELLQGVADRVLNPGAGPDVHAIEARARG